MCGTVAEAGDKFCSNCGSSLEPDAAAEASQDDLSRYLPEELLTKMRSARAGHAMQGERRTVTMLFADVTGSTAAAEQFDPEDWVEIMNGAFEHLIAPIYRYEGTLAQLRGDAILAFFGAPIAHEDDPVRALRAGLEMLEAITGYSTQVQAEWGIPLQIRVGVNTGLVVVGEVGSDLRVEYTALGDAINVAARMEQTAQPGTVQITDETLLRTGGAFATEEIGPVEVKGKSLPVTSHRVVRYVGEVEDAVDSPILGRETELDSLNSLLTTLTGGSGWISTLIAEAGVGKTRLLQEWRVLAGLSYEIADTYDSDGDVVWLSEACRSYDSNDPLSTVRNLLRRFWGVSEGPPDFDLVTRAADATEIDNPDTVAALSHIGGVTLSEPAEAFINALETPALNAKVAEAFMEYISALAGQRPVVIVLEDLHWADDVSLALIERCMELTEGTDVGIMASMRPYRDEPTWRFHEVAERNHHHRYHPLELSALPADDGSHLLDSLTDTSSLSKDERANILERADGNPLFIEEIAKSLAEVDAGSTLPSSLTGTLTARLDRLDDQSKYLIQVASVLGTEFDRETLQVVLENQSFQDQMTDLLRRGILVEGAETPGTVRFRHALFQEAAYETILKRTRRQLHQRLADYLVEEHPDRALEISTHLVEAGEATKAFPYLIEAGLLASRSMSLGESIRLLTTALDNLPESPDPELIEKAHDALGEAYSLVPDLSQASAAYQSLYEFGENQDRPAARVTALNRLAWTAATLGGDLDGATKYLEDARDLAEECGDDVGLAEYHMTSCFVASLAGNVATAVQHDEKTVELGEKSGVDVIRITGMVRRAVNYTSLLDFDKAMIAVEQGLEETREAGQDEAHAVVECFGVGVERFLRGHPSKALEVMQRSDKTLERFSSFYRAMNLRNMAVLAHEMGDLEDALGRFVDSMRVGDRQNQPFISAAGASGAALMYAELGLTEPISDLRERAEASFQGPMADFLASSIWADLGFVSFHAGDFESAAKEFSTGLSVSSTTQYIERPRLLTGQALTATHMGELDIAVAAVEEARTIIDEKDLMIYEASVGYADGLALVEQQRLDDADRVFLSAQQKAMDLGQRLRLARILQARADIASTQRRGEDESKLSADASQLVEAIGESIVDETLKKSFTDAAARQEVATD